MGSLSWHVANNNDAPAVPIAIGKWQLVRALPDATTSMAHLQRGPVQQANQRLIAAWCALNGWIFSGGTGLRAALGASDRRFVEEAPRGKFGL